MRDRGPTPDGDAGDALEAWFARWLARLDDEHADARLEAYRVLEEAPEVLRPLLRQQMASVLELATTTLAGADVAEGKLLGGYRLEGVLGRGATGVVWSATTADGEERAIKFVHSLYLASPEGVARLGLEVRAASRVDHPGVVRLRDTLELADSFGLVSDRVGDGSTLADEIGRAEKLGLPVDGRRMLERLLPVLRGVAALHRADVLHLDLKPGNLLVDEDGALLVTDFGLALLIDQPGTTRTFQLLGTPAYMAPELARGDRRSADRRSDVFSLGVTIYESLGLGRPFTGSGSRGVLESVLHDEPPPLPGPLRGLSARQLARLRAVLARCLEKAPAHRYSDVDALADDVEAVLAGDRVHGRSTWRRVLAATKRRRRPLAATLFVLALLALGWRDRSLRRDTHDALAITNQLVGAMRPGGQPPGRGELEPLVRDLQRLLRSTPDPLRDQTLKSVGVLLAQRGETTDLARELFEEGLGLARDEEARGSLLLELGLLHHRRFKLEPSIDYLLRAAISLEAQEDAVPRLQRAFCVVRACSDRMRLNGGLGGMGEPTAAEAIILAGEALGSTPADLNRALRARLELEVLQLEHAINGDGIPPSHVERMEELLGELRRQLGRGHPWVIEALTYVGNAMTDLRGEQEAMAHLLEALSRAEDSLGRTHVQTLLARARLARARLDLHGLESAEQAYQGYASAIEALEVQLGPENRTVLDFSIGLNSAMEVTGRHKEQEPFMKDLLARGESVLGPTDPVFTLMQRAWVILCLDNARPVEGRKTLTEQWEGYLPGLRHQRRTACQDVHFAASLELLYPGSAADVDAVLERIDAVESDLLESPPELAIGWDWRRSIGGPREFAQILRAGAPGRMDRVEELLLESEYLEPGEIEPLNRMLRIRTMRLTNKLEEAARLTEDLWAVPPPHKTYVSMALVMEGLRLDADLGEFELLRRHAESEGAWSGKDPVIRAVAAKLLEKK